MPANVFRYIVGVLMLLVHFCGIALIVTNRGRFDDWKDLISSILILSPITLVYATAFLHFVLANAEGPVVTLQRFNRGFVFVSLLVVSMFCVALIYVVGLYVFVGGMKPNDFKISLGGVETAFGALTGLVFDKLFSARVAAPVIRHG